MNERRDWSYAPSYDLTYAPSNHNLQWHQLTIGKSPSHAVRSLGLIKIAKLCDVKEPLKIISSMIQVKRDRLGTLAKEYSLEEVAMMILDDTKNIDDTFYKEVAQ